MKRQLQVIIKVFFFSTLDCTICIFQYSISLFYKFAKKKTKAYFDMIMMCSSGKFFVFKKYKENMILFTRLLLQVFNCLPCDSVTTFDELRHYRQSTPLSMSDPVAAKKQLEKVKGHLVMYPLQFLKEETLLNYMGAKENLVPIKFWMWRERASAGTVLWELTSCLLSLWASGCALLRVASYWNICSLAVSYAIYATD